jgi:hypothetical protein
MIEVTETIIYKYQKGTSPNEGVVVWSNVSKRDSVNKKAFNRLYTYIQGKDDNLHSYEFGNKAVLRRELADGLFNDSGVVVFEKDISDNKDFHKRAMQRLARYLTDRSDEYNYYGGVPLVEVGENCYQYAIRNTIVYNHIDKEKKIKKLVSARKSVITRSLNKAKKIREGYFNSLFPEYYKTDEKIAKLLTNLKKQKIRLHIAKRMKPSEYEDTIGDIKPTSLKSFNKVLKEYQMAI